MHRISSLPREGGGIKKNTNWCCGSKNTHNSNQKKTIKTKTHKKIEKNKKPQNQNCTKNSITVKSDIVHKKKRYRGRGKLGKKNSFSILFVNWRGLNST
jgi:hypothetical protein